MTQAVNRRWLLPITAGDRCHFCWWVYKKHITIPQKIYSATENVKSINKKENQINTTLACNASGLYQCRQMSNNKTNIVFFSDVSRRLWLREQCHKKDTVARKKFVVIVSPVGINADTKDETTNFVKFKIRNAYLRGQITFLFTIRDVQNTKRGPAKG